MGLLDGLLGRGGSGGGLAGLANLIANNPQLLAAAASLLSSRDGSVGGTSGLAGLLKALQNNGLGDVASSWISTGENQAISPGQLASVLGPDTLGEIAQRAGLSTGDAGTALAGLLPQLVDTLTPNGQLPDRDGLEGMLGSLLAGLQR